MPNANTGCGKTIFIIYRAWHTEVAGLLLSGWVPLIWLSCGSLKAETQFSKVFSLTAPSSSSINNIKKIHFIIVLMKQNLPRIYLNLLWCSYILCCDHLTWCCCFFWYWKPPDLSTVWQSTAGLSALPIIRAYRGVSVLTSGGTGGGCIEWMGVCLCKKVGCLLARSLSLYLPHRAYSTGKYGSIGPTVRERSVHVEGHEIGVSGEAISLLTPRARGWPSLHHRSAVGTHPHLLLLDYNRSNYYSLLVTVAQTEREKNNAFLLISTINIWVGWGQETRNYMWPHLKKGLIEATGFTETGWLLTCLCQSKQTTQQKKYSHS